MTAARALDVIHVNGAAADRVHRILAEAEFVDGIGVEVHRKVVTVGGDQRLIDDGGRGPEILVDFHGTRRPRR